MNWRIDEMKKALCIAGVGLIIGGAAVAFYLLSNKKKGYYENNVSKESEKRQYSVEGMTRSKTSTTQEEVLYENNKSSAIGDMYSRHQEAATIIRDYVETIRENVKVSTESNNEIDEVSAELDKMLIED